MLRLTNNTACVVRYLQPDHSYNKELCYTALCCICDPIQPCIKWWCHRNSYLQYTLLMGGKGTRIIMCNQDAGFDDSSAKSFKECCDSGRVAFLRGERHRVQLSRSSFPVIPRSRYLTGHNQHHSASCRHVWYAESIVAINWSMSILWSTLLIGGKGRINRMPA